MEKTDTVDEYDNIDNDEERDGGTHNKRSIRKKISKNCRIRNILQRDESIRKEEVRGII